MASPKSSPNSPGSPLSSLSSEDFGPQDIKPEEFDNNTSPTQSPSRRAMRPAKRQRTGPSWEPAARRETPEPAPAPAPEDDIQVSSDTEGSVPGSPGHAAMVAQDEEAMGHEQVSVCKWDGCELGETGNMDKLVEHIHEEHIGARRQRYSCEWVDCARKGIPHASGYALRAHMRSHTREKPFYCALPECDRSFTRSDALAKHMRTVHETEALRPSDPVPKHHSANPSNRLQRLKLTFKANSSGAPGGYQAGTDGNLTDDGSAFGGLAPGAAAEAMDPNNIAYEPVTRNASSTSNGHKNYGPLTQSNPAYRIVFPPDLHFTPSEADLPADQLYRLLRRQHAWAEDDTRDLKAEVERLERERREEWLAKELVLENLMEADVAVAERRAARKLRRLNLVDREVEEAVAVRMGEGVAVSKTLTLDRGVPWWRRTEEEEEEEKKKGLVDEEARKRSEGREGRVDGDGDGDADDEDVDGGDGDGDGDGDMVVETQEDGGGVPVTVEVALNG